MITAVSSEKDAIDFLKSKKIKPSVIRVKVLKYLAGNEEHPSAETVYRNVVKQIPTLSKTSVYNALKTFVDMNIISEVYIGDTEMRYDPSMKSHAHFKCIKCGVLKDVGLNNVEVNTGEVKDSLVLEQHVYLKGICGECKKRNTDS